MKRQYKIVSVYQMRFFNQIEEELNKYWEKWWELAFVVERSYIVLKRPKLD